MNKKGLTILVTGASGLVGNKVFTILSQTYSCVGAYHSKPIPGGVQIDLTDENVAPGVLAEIKPDVIVHAMGEPNVGVAEENPELAYARNVTSTKIVTEYAREHGIKLVHLSTDYVFPGKESGMYKEDDERQAVNYYGKTKREAEDVALSYPNHILIRFDKVFGYNGKGMANGLIGEIERADAEFPRDAHRLRQIMFSDDIARAIQFLLEKDQTGIFHLGSDLVTVYDVSVELEKIIRGENTYVVPMEGHLDNLQRPKTIHLDVSKIENLGFTFHTIPECLEIIKEQYDSAA